MIGVSFATETWRVVTAAVVVDNGNEIPDWTRPVDGPEIQGCVSWPGPTADTTERRDGDRIERTALLPAGTVVPDAARLRDPHGVLWRVVGEPQRWRSPTGALDSVAAELIRWKG